MIEPAERPFKEENMNVSKKNLLLFVIATLLAGCTRGRESRNISLKESYVVSYLDITPEQRPFVRDLLESFNSTHTKIENEKRRIHIELSDLIRADAFDKSKAHDLMRASKTTFDNESEALIEKFTILHSKLSSEQKQKLSKLIQNHDN